MIRPTDHHPGTAPAQAGSSQPVRPAVLIPLLLVVLACLAACVALWMTRQAPGRGRAPPVVNSQPEAQPAPVASPSADENLPVSGTNPAVATVAPGKSQTPLRRRPTTLLSTPRPAPSAYTRQLVSQLVNLDQSGPPKTAEEIAAWKQHLQQLVQQGFAAVPAIREFLEQNLDFTFGADSAQALGYDSARAAMYDALAQIGGPDASSLLLDTLQTTASPHDIAQLARTLEQLSPEQYQPQILEAVRQALSMPADAQAAQTDVGPLFAVLAKYGSAGALADLGDTPNRWKYYTAIALAQLPDAAGVPALVQMVQGPGSGPVQNVPALEMLTQLAAQNPDARSALLQQVQANNIPPGIWAYLSAALVGDQVQFQDSGTGAASLPNSTDLRTFHIASGNQNFYTAPPPGGLSADQLNQQLALVDQLLSAAPNPTAQQTLQQARDLLLQRSSPAPPAPK